MICDITQDIVEICNKLVVEYENPSKIVLFHYILHFIFKKIKENNNILVFFIEKRKISVFLKEIQQLFKNFPIYTIISNELPEENEEFTCIIAKFNQNLVKNIKKLHKFLIRNQLSYLQSMFSKDNIGVHCVSCYL